MIEPMLKYTFVVFHSDYQDFLTSLQELGVVHVVIKTKDVSEKMRLKTNEIKKHDEILRLLRNRNNLPPVDECNLSSKEIIADITFKQKELEELHNALEEAKKEYEKAKSWGNFSLEIIEKLKQENIELRLFSAPNKKFASIKNSGIPVELVSESSNLSYFVFIQTKDNVNEPEAQEIEFPKKSYTEIQQHIQNLETQIESIHIALNEYSGNSIEKIENAKIEVIQSLQFDNVVQNTSNKADNKVMLLEGWAPKSKSDLLKKYLEKSEAIYVSSKATPNDKIPVLLVNNRFSKPFEPIGSMFSFPDYGELDLTVFFAPFFMLFFGFCLGDAGYGLLFLVGAGIYKLKAAQEIKPYLSLIQFLGVATILFGAVSGTFFGINLIETEFSFTDNFRSLFLNPDKMFQLSLVLGAIQIIFGLFIRAANQIKQFGFQYALATFGWLIILLGGILYAILTGTNVIPNNKSILYAILLVGGIFILFFSDPSINVFARIGKGIWDIYSTVTGIFGDLLSYIRLFALGLSSAILGFVINDIGLQILGSSKILGPIFFIVFLLIGHTLNILISSLGSFVHPMRLTFVEFYKSAGFKGGGEEYKPFKR